MSSDFRAAKSESPDLNGAGLRIGIVCGRFNDLITNRLLDGAAKALSETGVADGDINVVWVPGAFEIPLVAKALALSGDCDAVITLGAVIRGDTAHFEYVAGPCAQGIQSAQLETGIPIIFGVLTTENLQQALDRSGDDDNKGGEAVRTAIEMVNVLRTVRGN